MKTNLKGELTSSLLAPALRARFSQLFSVASRKSVFDWRESVLPEAQVVVVDGTSNLQRVQTQAPPCVIWVGAAPPAPAFAQQWTGQLAQDYTVADLIDMLDRAAVFLLDWKARRSISQDGADASRAVEDSLRPLDHLASDSGGLAAAHATCYRLATWVFLGAPFDSAGHVGALALLARQPVTAQQLHHHSGLPLAAVADLLRELARRKVLRASARVRTPSIAPSGPPQAAAAVQKGFVRRLAHWLKAGGRA